MSAAAVLVGNHVTPFRQTADQPPFFPFFVPRSRYTSETRPCQIGDGFS
jgi:hypothetical protein